MQNGWFLEADKKLTLFRTNEIIKAYNLLMVAVFSYPKQKPSKMCLILIQNRFNCSFYIQNRVNENTEIIN